jgi:hypothetical protein
LIALGSSPEAFFRSTGGGGKNFDWGPVFLCRTPGEAADIAKVVDAYVNAYQTAELDERVARVELLIREPQLHHRTGNAVSALLRLVKRALCLGRTHPLGTGGALTHLCSL